MYKRIITAIVLSTAITSAAAAQTAPRNAFTIQPESRVSVEGTSSVRGWTCQAEKIDGAVMTDDAQLTLGRASNAASATMSIDVARLECGNGTMNGHMRRALKDQTAPQILFRYQRLETTGSTARVTGQLTMAGQTRPVTVEGQLVEEAGGALRLRGQYELKMTDWQIDPPRLMAGTLKVHDPVRINFDVLFRQ
jgi:polyisoprenoid-binding protein YceI